MAYILKKDKQIAIISALAEGNSIRSTERMTGCHRDTIMRLGVRVGKGCAKMLDQRRRNLDCRRIEVDEIWGFIGKKKKNVKRSDPQEMGDAWTFIAIDAETKLIPSYRIGKRDVFTTHAFIHDLSKRLRNRIQLSSDTMNAYASTIEATFGADGVDFAQIVKTFVAPKSKPASIRYSPGDVVRVKKKRTFGAPNPSMVSTSYIERQNLTLRMHCRRLTRLTNAFSKKLENFKAAVALNFAYYNYCLRHSTLAMTPAMASGVADSKWTVADLLEASGDD